LVLKKPSLYKRWEILGLSNPIQLDKGVMTWALLYTWAFELWSDDPPY